MRKADPRREEEPGGRRRPSPGIAPGAIHASAASLVQIGLDPPAVAAAARDRAAQVWAVPRLLLQVGGSDRLGVVTRKRMS